MQQLAHMAGVVVHSELLLNHPRDHGRGPDSGVQAIGHRAAVQDVLQGLLVRATQLRRSSAALSFQQTFDAMGFITCQPLGNLGAWGLQNRRQLPAAAPLRIQHYCLQPLGHAIGSVSFRLFAQTNQPLIGAGVQTNHSRKHGTPPKASMPSFFCYVPLLMRICITTLVTDQPTVRIHHTEYEMPASGMLFANDHDAGRTFIFDVRDPLHPKIVTSFTEMDGYMHPHSYLRLPDGNVLASFQHAHHEAHEGQMGASGGLVEIDDSGKVIRSASSADPALPNALLMPYSLAVLPDLDRVVVTNSSMHDDDIFSGVTYQLFRLSDLKLLKTSYFDVGANHYGHVSPEEPRRGPDGS